MSWCYIGWEQVAVYGVPAVYCLCDVWGLLCLQTRYGKDGEAPSNVVFVWTGGEISVWSWSPDQTIPPVADQVAGNSAMWAGCVTVKYVFWGSLCLKRLVDNLYLVYLVQVSLRKGQKVTVSTWRGAFEVMTESAQRTMCHRPGMR